MSRPYVGRSAYEAETIREPGTGFPKEGLKRPLPSLAPQGLRDLWPLQEELMRSAWHDFCQAHSTTSLPPSAKWPLENRKV